MRLDRDRRELLDLTPHFSADREVLRRLSVRSLHSNAIRSNLERLFVANKRQGMGRKQDVSTIPRAFIENSQEAT